VEWLVAKQYEKNEWHGNFLHHKPTPPFCILHPMANDPDLVYTRCGSQEGYIKLEGDRTRLISGQIAPLKLQKIIDNINWNRIFRGKR
jgi:hypothetical protein